QLKLPNIKLAPNDPFHDPGQKTFISVAQVNHPGHASMDKTPLNLPSPKALKKVILPDSPV
ncbi:MAG: hypothetical protein ACK56F_04795, partial [bacterium]